MKILFRILLVLGGMALLLIGIAAWTLAPKLKNLKSEYGTADAIRATEAFVKEHHGQWPKSWSDLGMSNQDALTTMNFNLNPNTATKETVLTAIQPRNGKYYTFPHSVWMLENVYAEMTNGLKWAYPAASPAPPPPSAGPVSGDKH